MPEDRWQNEMTTTQEQLSNLCDHVRRRPGMYLGSTGPAAIPRLVDGIINAAFAAATVVGEPSILLSITKQHGSQTISILLTGLRSAMFPPHDPPRWFQGVLGNAGWEFAAAAGIS